MHCMDSVTRSSEVRQKYKTKYHSPRHLSPLSMTIPVRSAVIRMSFASIADTLREEFASKG